MSATSLPEAASVRSALVAAGAALPGWLATRRWFADKGREISDVAFEDALIDRVGDDWLALAVFRIAFAAGQDARYLLPLALTVAPTAAATISGVSGAPGYALSDATETPGFGHWLLRRLREGTAAGEEAWHWRGDPDALAAAAGEAATLSAAEQSNTSLRFGQALMVKLVRRLQPGPNPDEEALRGLAAIGFAHVPAYAGAASWRAVDGVEHPIALAQRFVPNEGDGWSWTLARLDAFARGTAGPDRAGFEPERLLGQRTGELHLALSQVADPAFRPVGVDAASMAGNEARTNRAIDQAVVLLADHRDLLPLALRAGLPDLTARLEGLRPRLRGYRDEAGTVRARVHGDYHLGQTLRTPAGDWIIIDFEGEPARPVAERRERASALKDVAGMLRSFGYARGAAERALGADADEAARARLAHWEAGARGAFLAGYRAALAAAPLPLVPDDEEAFSRALAAWELDKALYEIAYEVRNRPDWLELPLRALQA